VSAMPSVPALIGYGTARFPCGLVESHAVPAKSGARICEVPMMKDSHVWFAGAMSICAVGARGRRWWKAPHACKLVGGTYPQRRVHQRVAARAASKMNSWRELESDFESEFGEIFDENKKAPKQKTAGVKVDNFEDGADFAKAKMFAATRVLAVAPWSQDVKAKPIFAVSDNTGKVAAQLSEAAFMQFGSPEKVNIQVFAKIRTEEQVHEVVAQAASMAPSDALAIEMSGAIIVFTLADAGLSDLLIQEAQKKGVPCINVLEGVLSAMEKRFHMPRSVYSEEGALLDAFEEEGLTVFAVSDSSANSTYDIVSAALQQFPGCGVDHITICAQVRSLEEINHIVEEALALDSLIIFTFASPGMSRFIRQQCERAKVPYTDAYQPVLIAFEKYLDYPPVGVPGGHELKSTPSPHLSWERRRVPH